MMWQPIHCAHCGGQVGIDHGIVRLRKICNRCGAMTEFVGTGPQENHVVTGTLVSAGRGKWTSETEAADHLMRHNKGVDERKC